MLETKTDEKVKSSEFILVHQVQTKYDVINVK